MEILKARVERRHRVVFRRLDVDLIVGVILFAGVRRSLRHQLLDDGWSTDHWTKRRLMQRRVHGRNQRFRGT